MRTSGRPGAISTVTLCRARSFSISFSVTWTRSLTSHQSSFGFTWPASSRVMFSRLPTRRLSRPAASWISPTIACWNSESRLPPPSLRLLAALVMAVMGVRISCEMELSSVLLRRSDSATSLACCSASRSRCRSSTSAIWRTKASSKSRWAGGERGGVAEAQAEHADGPFARQQRQVQALGRRQGVRAAPGRLPMAESPRRDALLLLGSWSRCSRNRA